MERLLERIGMGTTEIRWSLPSDCRRQSTHSATDVRIQFDEIMGVSEEGEEKETPGDSR